MTSLVTVSECGYLGSYEDLKEEFREYKYRSDQELPEEDWLNRLSCGYYSVRGNESLGRTHCK